MSLQMVALKEWACHIGRRVQRKYIHLRAFRYWMFYPGRSYCKFYLIKSTDPQYAGVAMLKFGPVDIDIVLR